MTVEEEIGRLVPRETCWSALARVVDNEPTFVFADGDANGMTVECMVLTGPFQGAEVAAMIACPLGATFETRPIRSGNRVLLQFLDGTPDGEIVAVATVPGGRANKIPTAMAGVAVDEGALQNEQLIAPPKGANVRFYVRGGAFLVRLKGNGKQSKADGSAFAGELYIEADDAADSPEGSTGTFIRLVRDAQSGKFVIKLRDATGASVTIKEGTIIASDATADNVMQLGPDGAQFNVKAFNVNAGTVRIDGPTYLNYPPGIPPTPATGGALSAKIGGAVAGVADISKKVFIGL